MDNKVLIVTGPTSIGKTNLALKFAKKFNGDILSADSRQVYKELDVVTGKDIPVNSKWQISNIKYNRRKIGFWKTKEGIRIWLVDLVKTGQKFSVSHWIQAAKKLIPLLWQEGKLPIIVGATGFYIDMLISGAETVDIPSNKDLRLSLQEKSVAELQNILTEADFEKYSSLNESDRNNPRRLIRAIEVAEWKRRHPLKKGVSLEVDTLFIGLNAPQEVLRARIDKRVEGRFNEEAVNEAKLLLDKNIKEDRGTGYLPLKRYILGEMDKEEAIREWKQLEYQDAKKQLNWFKNDSRVVWFDITSDHWHEEVEKYVGNWYSSIK